MEKIKKYTCLLCGRNKFTLKSAHICNGQYRKRKIKWVENIDTQSSAKAE
jgi:hypothetical protein